MAASKVDVVRNGTTETLIDLTADTVDAAHLAQGYTAHGANGAAITGTMAASSGQKVYCGTSAPSSSIGSDGDLYLVLTGGGSIEVYPADYEASNISNSSNASAAIGKSASAGSSTSNIYSSSSGTTGVVEYSFDLSGIPSDATISSVTCQVKAHEENASRSEFTLQLYSGSTAKVSLLARRWLSSTQRSCRTNASWLSPRTAGHSAAASTRSPAQAGSRSRAPRSMPRSRRSR